VPNVLEAKNITKVYKQNDHRIFALGNLDLSLSKGEFLAVAGVTGSGKSTLIALLSGLDTPTAGEVSLHGRNICGLGEKGRAALRLEHFAFITRDTLLLEQLSLAENVALPLRLAGYAKEASLQRAMTMLAELEMDREAHRSPGMLSADQRQSAGIARAFAAHPDVVFADEPGGMPDKAAADALMQRLRRMHAKLPETALVLTVREPGMAGEADRTILLEHGKIPKETKGNRT
jgi:ABC-type lipoprotein export system ATPase subunit